MKPQYACLFAATAASAFHNPSLTGEQRRRTSYNSNNANNSICRCFPGDACWPTAQDWDAFNKTVGGRLVATVPVAAACHDSSFAAYDAEACAALRAVWWVPQTHYSTSSSVMAPFFANASCDPFTDPEAQCVTGAYVQYAVNASGVDDYRATLAFATQRNLRLVVRNTGHDYYGKSTGAGGLALWTHHLKRTTLVPNYSSPGYSGRALKVGAGVQVFEAYEAAERAGVTVVGGSCDTVGIAGGFSQGGGHGPLNSKFGLGADQVLEWEVVTATGEHLVASPEQNEDLYWALSGGGGGSYAAVLSATVKAHDDFDVVSGATLFFTDDGISNEEFWGILRTFLSSLPPMADAGSWSGWQTAQGWFSLNPLFAPGLDKEAIQALLDPTLRALNASGASYTYTIQQWDSFMSAYRTLIPSNNITEYNIGGRLIPRDVVANNVSLASLIDGMQFIVAHGGGIAGNHFNVSQFPGPEQSNSVNPVWRTAVSDFVLGLPYDTSNFRANFEVQRQMTDVLMPALEAVTPGGGTYLNEGDFRQSDWQTAFYGGYYDALQQVKDKYDPNEIFYGLTAVGSDRWAVREDGRLCKST